MATNNLTRLLEELATAGVDFIVVGGLAAVAQGTPMTTFDVDIVHARDEGNVDRLLEFLSRINARYRGRPGNQIIRPERRALLGVGHNLLMTDLGPLDILGAIEGGLKFEDLVGEAIELRIGDQQIRFLRLSKLVEFKRQSSHPKDKQALPILEATLRALNGEDSES